MKFTYAKDKQNEGVYNVRVVGTDAMSMSGQTVHVTTAGGAEKPETLGRRIWPKDGADERDRETGEPIALYAKGGNNAQRGGGDDKWRKDMEERVRLLEQRLATMGFNAAGASSVADDLPY